MLNVTRGLKVMSLHVDFKPFEQLYVFLCLFSKNHHVRIASDI